MKICKIEETTTGFVFDFGGNTLTVDCADVSAAIAERAMRHGIKQKVSDSYASNNGRADAFEKARETWTTLVEGEWNKFRGNIAAGGIVEALSRETGKTLDDCAVVYAAMDKDQQAKLRKHPRMALHLITIKQERLAKKVGAGDSDSGDSLDELFE